MLWIEFPLFAPNSAGTPHQRSKFTFDSILNLVPQLNLVALNFSGRGDSLKKDLLLESCANPIAAEKLGSLFDSYGSDKRTPHNYHNFYSSLFSDPTKVGNIFEIGLGTPNLKVISNMGLHGKPGSSLRAFRDFFTSANVYGADVDRDILFEEERITTYWVDQTQVSTLKDAFVATGVNLDLIIDDGLHSPEANLNTLIAALPCLNVGGWFIVEDVATESIPLWKLVSLILDTNSFSSTIVLGKTAHLFAVQRLK